MFSVPRLNNTLLGDVVIPNRDTTTPRRLSSLADIDPIKRCAGILRTTKT